MTVTGNIIFSDEENFIVSSNKDVIDFLQENDISSVYTFDFENLYTSLPHKKLLEACSCIFDLYLQDMHFDKKYWMDLANFNISENQLFNGLDFAVQRIGIPMGTAFSSALANIFLHLHEKNIFHRGIYNGFRYIDDLLIINSEDIDSVLSCYPEELRLNCTNSSPLSADFLDISIKIVGSSAKISLFDKRDNFDFRVLKFCNFHSNLHHRIFRNVVFAQIWRIKKICNNLSDFLVASKALKNSLIDNNFPKNFCKFESLIDSLEESFS